MVTTATCLDLECFGVDGAASVTLADVCHGISYDEIRKAVEVLTEADGGSHHPATLVAWNLDRGELSLAYALDGDDGLVVLNDEEAFDTLRTLVESGDLDLYPVPSLRFAWSMYDCGALDSDEVLGIGVQMTVDLNDRLTTMSERKRHRKKRDVEELVHRVELREAQRHHGARDRTAET